MIHQLPSESHQSCRRRQSGPPCEATTRTPSLWSMGFISTWTTVYDNLCTVQQVRAGIKWAGRHDELLVPVSSLKSKETRKPCVNIDVLLSQRAITRPLLVSDQDSATWSWNYQSHFRRFFNGWYESTIRILSFLVLSTFAKNSHQFPVVKKL